MKFWFAFAALVALTAPVAAQDAYPTRPITMVVPFAAGGASDVIARLIAEQMGHALGQRLVIENVVGAGGSTGMTRASRAAADGYTIVIGNSGTATAVYALYPDIKFTPEDFAAIGIVAKTSAVIALKKDLPAKTLREFIDDAKQNPGKATLGHAGVGSSNYLICKAFVQAAGVDVTLVSYRGGAPALNDLLGGQIDGVCDNAASITPSIQSGLTNGVAIAGPSRLNSLPDVPTTIEAGLPEFPTAGLERIVRPQRHSATHHRKAHRGAAPGRRQRRLPQAARRAWRAAAHRRGNVARLSAEVRSARDRAISCTAGRKEVIPYAGPIGRPQHKNGRLS
jgi:tripartite-type tricarboxylate transporter receptor subunit TctC